MKRSLYIVWVCEKGEWEVISTYTQEKIDDIAKREGKSQKKLITVEEWLDFKVSFLQTMTKRKHFWSQEEVLDPEYAWEVEDED